MPYRASWIAALERNRSKGAPYWPESFWADVRHEMEITDLVPVILQSYTPYISSEVMRGVNRYLQTHILSKLAETPLGHNFCTLQQRADQAGQTTTLKLTQATIQRVYERDKPAIKAARAKYLQDHPDWHD